MTEVRLFNSTPLEFYGGGEVMALSIAKGLSANGFDVDFVCDNTASGVARITADRVADLTKGLRYRKSSFRYYSVAPVSALFHRLPDIDDLSTSGVNMIFVHRPPSPTFITRILKSRLRVVFLVHGISVEEHPQSSVVLLALQTGLKIYFHTQAERLNSGDIYFQVLNDQLGGFLKGEGVRAERITVIPNGLPSTDYNVSTSPLFDVIFLGRIERFVKGIDLLVKILDMLDPVMPSDMTVTILGSGADNSLLKRKVLSSWTSGRIKFRGFVSEPEKKQILSRASVMLVTSRVEAFSLASVEGLMSGLPVLSAPSSGPKFVVESHPDFGKVLPPSASSFVEWILRYYADWKHDSIGYLHRKQTRRDVASSIFSEANMTSAYVRMISTIASATAARGNAPAVD